MNITKAKNIIITLATFLGVAIITILGIIIYLNHEKRTIEITLDDSYTINNSFYTYYVVTIFAYEDTSIAVNDFTYKNEKGNICANKIEYNNNQYDSGESFLIKGKKENKLTIYINMTNEEADTIYYNRIPIKMFETIKTTKN